MLKGQFTKNETSVIIYSHKLFQTRMSFLVLLNTKDDILKNVDNQTEFFHVEATLVKNKYTKNVFEIHLFYAKYTTNTFTYLCV